MADKKKIAIQLSLDVDKQGAVAQVKNVTEQMKKILISFEKSGGSFEIFNDLVGYLKEVEEQCLKLKNINPLKFDELFGKQGGADLNSAISSQVVGILDTAKQVPEVIEGIQNKINNLGKQNSIKIADVRKVGNDIRSLYTLMGQTPKVDLDFENQKGSFDKLDILSNALKDFKVNWLDFVSTVKNNPNPLDDKGKVTGSGESPEVAAINQKIEELKAQKKGLEEISNAISGKKIKFVFNSEDEMLPKLKELVAEFKKAEEAKIHIEQFGDTSSDKYLDAVKKYIHAAKLLVAARDAVPYDDENSDAYKYASVGDASDIMEKADNALIRIKKKQDKNITESVTQKILDTVKQEIKDIDSEIKQLQNNKKNVTIEDKNNIPNSDSGHIDDRISKYKELKEALLEYKEATKTINFDDDATDEQINEAFNKQDELIGKIKNLTNIDSEKLDSILKPFDQDLNSDVETAYQNIVSILETDIPNAAHAAEDAMSSTFDKATNKANEISEAIKNAFESANNIEFNTRNDIANGQETMNLFGSDGSVSVANGTDYQVDTDSLVQQVVANLNKNIIMSLHNHANGDMAFSPSDINSFAKLYYGQGTKINGIIANGIIQTIDFNDIGQDVAINIAKDYQEGIKHLFEAKNISQYASITDDGIVPSDFLKQIQLKSTEKYQEIISQLQEAMTIVLRQSFEKNGADFTLQAFSLDDIEKLATYLTNVQESANSVLAPVEKLKNLIATLRPDVNLNEFADIFDKFKNGAIDGTKALNQILGVASEGQNQVDQLKRATEALQEFAALKDEILGKAASSEGGSMDDVSIGKYTERVTIAKEKLDELAKQSLLTAEQVKEANDIYEIALGNLESKQRTNNTHLEDLESRELQGSYDDGYDRGYYDAKTDSDVELDNLQKQLDAAEAELHRTKTSIDSGTPVDTSIELQNLENLRSELAEVKNAIIAKNKAFNDEGVIVGQVVGKEIASLQHLLNKVNDISSALNKLFDNLTSGTDISSGLDNVNINVNGRVNGTESSSYALESTLTETNSILGDIRSSVNSIKKDTPKIQRPTQEANARVADSKQYEQIRAVTLNAVSDRGTESKITGMKALVDGLVQVNGYIKTAEGNYESFTVKVNEANETIGLAFSENKKLTQQMQQEANAQEAFSNNFNLIADEFVKYTESIDQSDQVTAKFSSQIQQMENRLAAVANSAELDVWKSDWDALTASIAAAKQKQEQLALAAQKLKDKGILKAAGKSVDETYRPFKTTASKMTPELEEIQKKYNKIGEVIEKYKNKSEALTQEEINGLKQLETELQKLTQEYTRKMQAEQRQENAAKNAYGASQIKNIGKKYTQLSGVASGAEFADSATVQAALSNLETSYQKLIDKQKEFAGIDPTAEQKQEFARLTDQYNQAHSALDNIIKSSRKLAEKEIGDPYEIVSGTNMADEGIRMQELQNAVNLFSNGSAKIGQFNADFTELSYTVKNADGTFTDFTAVLDTTGTKIINVAGKTKESTSLFKGAFDSLKKKSKEILTYMVSMGGLSRVFGQIRQGVQYVKEIDSALTELKKVTDETDETYAKFLKTASAVGAEIGTTISDFTNATADFARLGYSITEATDLAKAASIYKNVGDGINSVSDASESIISTMKAFGIEANDAIGIVDRFNEVGKILP